MTHDHYPYSDSIGCPICEAEKASVRRLDEALSKDHPMVKAWDEFCDTDEFKNALRWAVETKYDDGRPINDIQREQHAKGSMWLAFTKGMECREGS